MFNLNTASIGVRKAAYLAGIKSGEFEPVFDPQGGIDAIVAKVDGCGNKIVLTSGDVTYAQAQTWNEIRRDG